MLVNFTIHYTTKWGERLFVTGNISELGNANLREAVPLNFDNFYWSKEIEIDSSETFSYSYIIIDDSNDIFCESSPPRFFKHQGFLKYSLMDEWQNFSDETPFMSNAIRKVLFNRTDTNYQTTEDKNLIIRTSVTNITEEEDLCIVGSTDSLGLWSPERAVTLYPDSDGSFVVYLDTMLLPDHFEYKFIVKSRLTGDFIWEEGENRKLNITDLSKTTLFIRTHRCVNLPIKKIRICGTAVPVFSLRRINDDGIGDFGSLYLMIDFISTTNQSILQLLPVNDTTLTHSWQDSYPYSPISVFALNPLYINLKELGQLHDSEFLKNYTKKSRKLNALKAIDYEGVDNLKWSYLKKSFEENWQSLKYSEEFKKFLKQNFDWLLPYAAFSFLRDKFKTPDFKLWPEYSVYDKNAIIKAIEVDTDFANGINLHYYVQFHLYAQLEKVHNYATEKGIILKGDIPIGVNSFSVETWSEPHIFNMNQQAGAPPDSFSESGQNWGFPTYNWNNIDFEGYMWWRRRLMNMESFFDAYRIDHILGFFRIWEIPLPFKSGIMGHFNPALPFSKEEIEGYGLHIDFEKDYSHILLDDLNSTDVLFVQDPYTTDKYHPRIMSQFTSRYKKLTNKERENYDRLYSDFFYRRNNDLWYQSAIKKLPPLISATGMLACGEDLGMIPSCVPDVMGKLRILSLEIQRMPKNNNVLFGNPDTYSYFSVCSTSTHDISTLREWWETLGKEKEIYYHSYLHFTHKAPKSCKIAICQEIIRQHLESSSMMAILPIQDWMSLNKNTRRDNPKEERINDPSDSNNYWQFRIHLNMEKILSNKTFLNKIKQMVNDSGRIAKK
ncbi:MAG: 4-alpha-glucanotransferase [Rikenellaceae bacterium]